MNSTTLLPLYGIVKCSTLQLQLQQFPVAIADNLMHIQISRRELSRKYQEMALGTRAISNGSGQNVGGGRNDDRQLGDEEEGAEQNES